MAEDKGIKEIQELTAKMLKGAQHYDDGELVGGGWFESIKSGINQQVNLTHTGDRLPIGPEEEKAKGSPSEMHFSPFMEGSKSAQMLAHLRTMLKAWRDSIAKAEDPFARHIQFEIRSKFIQKEKKWFQQYMQERSKVYQQDKEALKKIKESFVVVQ